MLWLKSKHINEAINKVADRIEKQIDVKEIVDDITNSLKERIIDIVLKDCGFNRVTYANRFEDNFKFMVDKYLKKQAILIAEEAREQYETEILKNLDSKEIQKLVEDGIKEKVKTSLK